MEEHAAALLHRSLGPEGVVAEMDAAGVERAVIVPPTGRLNQFSLGVAAAHPGRFKGMAVLPLDKADSKQTVADWAERPTDMAGIRLSFAPWRQPSWLADGTADWFWPAAEEQGIPIMVWAPEQWPAVAAIADRHPGLRLIVDHMGLYVEVRDDEVAPAIEPVLDLASRPNVGVKLSALPCHSTQPYPFRNLHPSIERVFDAFGPERLFWGTDMTRLPCPYVQALTMFTEELDFLGPEDLRLIMGDALAGWLGWTG
jgi:predicted TIM-barrel fold metal-dependent hydrolase